MGLRLRPTSSCTRARPLPNLQVLPLLALLLTALVPTTVGRPDVVDPDPYIELRCRCPNIISGVPLNSISFVNVFRPGVHCANVEVIATLKNGDKTCLDPNAPAIKKIVMKILEGY
ncbi:platelet basic protein-like [Onychomys torridus]|uniref:platelet basic protein-like n=1 Tax=Onychomys torridus TaxID=38674 RepID=UPI00167FAE70|nr:platelet basic protein-like [Onychomys torridus]